MKSKKEIKYSAKKNNFVDLSQERMHLGLLKLLQLGFIGKMVKEKLYLVTLVAI